MTTALRVLIAIVALGLAGGAATRASEWLPLFDGHTLDGWKAPENPAAFRVVEGVLVAHGRRSHLYYVGGVAGGPFRDFELRLEVLTKPGANSGIYFHTQVQRRGWPRRGYEVQINNSHTDWRRTGSLYAIMDLAHTPVRDGEWFNLLLRVSGRRITIRLNGDVVVDYVEPAMPRRSWRWRERVLDGGTFALQSHDAGSEVHFRRIEVRRLPTEP